MKRKQALAGLERLGLRLRELRRKAGFSQTALAGRMGFNPRHGYKYVFRLEKGLVPNPTLRTVSSFAAACGASWQDIVDVLPTSGGEAKASETEVPRPAPVIISQTRTEPARRSGEAASVGRERLRDVLVRRHAAQGERLWVAVAKAEEEAFRLLGTSRVRASEQRAYLELVRVFCSVIDSCPPERQQVRERELAKFAQAGVARGLDRAIIQQIQAVCIEISSQPVADR